MAFYNHLAKDECQFVHNVKSEIELYEEKSDRGRVLVFPPLSSRLRYLIHRTIEDLPELTTFSVGEKWCRQVVVCYSELRDEVEKDSDLESNNTQSETENDLKPKTSVPPRSRGPKRPDKPLYMPRAVRQRLSLQKPQGPSEDQEVHSQATSSCSSISSLSDSCSRPETTENIKSSSTSGQETIPNSVPRHDPDSSEFYPETPQTLHGTEPLVWDQTVSCLADMSLEEDEEDLASLIKAHLKEGVNFSIEPAQKDYSLYENVFINPDDLRYVIEIYNFPAMFKTDDLLGAFADYSEGGMKIKWIDNTHALGVFSCESAALHALSISHPLLKARSLAEGSKKAKGKAFRHAEFIQPVKERPRTDCAVAQRMVTRALGLQGRGRVQRY
ncbi:R3H and coiled-coil domain-containing protein 1 isoform X1 [Xyrichtys novacula]|uniref:R3H and coiled-coil domain-containing protein 1 isoform X1 n=1 Tax=Xyrichtys novacula TaxID=13765 RepID=A0AAV1ESQ7_XYRNO|nr:R3H and coiled-coil domain-containing protein 1 isoform X1 [Xyrichtys novacula]